MPPKKKAGKNGFWQFAMEIRQNKPLSNQELQEYAGRRWANMTKEERAPYEQRAALEKNNVSQAKYTSDGVSVDEIEQEQMKQRYQVESMKANIDSFMEAAAEAEVLSKEIFLIIHINHLIYHAADDRFYICEISVAPFSLWGGVDIENVFHRVVKPGKLPLGYYGPAQTHSKETHQMLQLVQEEPFEDNTEAVFNDLIKFLKPYRTDEQLPILYTQEKYLDIVRKVFATFSYDFNIPINVKVYNLEYMFYALKNAAARRKVWPTETFSFSELNRDIYAYTCGISCPFHEVSDITLYCSRCIVIRQAFTICDNCCGDLRIDKIPGYHVPGDSNSAYQGSSITNETTQISKYEPSVEQSPFDSDNFPGLGGGPSRYNAALSPSSSVWSVASSKKPYTNQNIKLPNKKRFTKFQ